MADKFRAVVFPIVLVIGACTFLATGIYLGYEIASTRGEASAWSCLANSADTYVRTLKRIRGGNNEDASVGLETALDINIIFMSGSGRKDVDDTLLRVKSYRNQFPWTSSSPEISSRVSKALAEAK